MIRFHSTSFSILLLSLLASAGCSSGSDHPPTAPVKGQVTYKGEPVSRASVAFMCSGAPRFGVGTTEADGSYQLTTYEPNDGAILGTHTITVTKIPGELQISPTAMEAPQESEAMAESIEKAMQQTARQLKKAENSPSEIPERYADRKTTDLRAEVVAGENTINLELVD